MLATSAITLVVRAAVIQPLYPIRPVRVGRSLKGHEDQFRLPSLSGCCWFGEATFAGIDGNDEVAPFPAIREAASKPAGFDARLAVPRPAINRFLRNPYRSQAPQTSLPISWLTR
jgi:hypothetical protein